MASTAKLPWASGPGEILRHGLSLLSRDTDVNRRLAMISIDNSVELMVKTYLGLPKRITGLSISREKQQEISKSFPALLDGLEAYAADKLSGIDLGIIEWYHRLRNELYHQGNGLTVERDKVEIYAQLANLLFKNLFGEELVAHEGSDTELLGEFISKWVSVESALYKLAELTYPDVGDGTRINREPIVSFLRRDKTIDKALAQEIDALRSIRNEVIHGAVDFRTSVNKKLLTRISEALEALTKTVAAVEREKAGN